MTADHDEFRRDLGVYVLGALAPAERDRFERHLGECAACRDELTSLAVLPGLLTRLGQDGTGMQAPPPVGPVVERLVEQRRRDRRRGRLLATATAVATMVAVLLVGVTLLPDRDGSPYVSDVSGVTATVEPRAWGMAVRIEAERLPDRPGYVAVAVAGDGHRTQVASWTRTGRPVKVEGACYLAPDDVDRMEILAASDDEVLAVLRPAR